MGFYTQTMTNDTALYKGSYPFMVSCYSFQYAQYPVFKILKMEKEVMRYLPLAYLYLIYNNLSQIFLHNICGLSANFKEQGELISMNLVSRLQEK